MKQRLCGVLTVCVAGLAFASCSSGSDPLAFNQLAAGVLAPAFSSATPQDLSGNQSSFSGSLNAGVSSTWPAVDGVVYAVTVDTASASDELTVDFWGADGSLLASGSVDSGNTFNYQHQGKSQHVLLVVRPRNPFNLSITVTGVTVVGTGNFARDLVRVNVIVAGKFTGLGAYNDLASNSDRGAFTNAVMTKVQALFAQTGIALSYEGFSYTAAQISTNSLIGPDEQAICTGVETRSQTGFDVVDTDGLDAWGAYGFSASDPNWDRAHGINVFIIHHFDQDGTVGLSPRPGVLIGNGRDATLACGAFLQRGGSLTPRTPDDIATVLAHELGHFLGLLHTTTFEPNPQAPTWAVDDGLAGTPRCTVLTDVNGDGYVGLGDGCQDEDNVMFYMAGNQLDFAADQAAIMQNLLSAQEH